MVRLHRLMLTIVSTGMLVLLTGCGHNASGNSTSPQGFSGTPGNAQQVKRGIGTGVPSPSSLSPSATEPLTGEVILQLDAMPQHASDTITIILSNQTNQVIAFPDHLTECTVILLQLQPKSSGSETWQVVAPCRIQTATRLHTLAPGKTLTVRLIPPDGQWISGIYRAQLSYFLPDTAHELKTVSSPSFQVGT